MEHIVTKVEKQELEITYIKKALDELVEQNKKQNEQLGKIGESIQKQEVILEKVSNLEDKYNDGLKRCHKRIDETLLTKNEIQKQIETEVSKNEKKIVAIENKIDQLKLEIRNKPCGTHNIVENELSHIKQDLASHKKIFWWGATLMIGTMVVTILKAFLHLKV